MMRERSGWRELDSNHRSRGRPRRNRGIGSRLRRLSVGGESSRADMSLSRNLLSRGTDGSIPASSSEESGANLISHYRAVAIFAGDRGFESISLQRGVCEASVPRLRGPAPAEAARRTTATSSEQGFIARLARSGGEIERRGSGSHADPHRYYPIQQPV